MSITTKTPPVKETVGAMYCCFDTTDESGNWTSTYEADVTKMKTVKSVSVTENADSSDVYASGEVYDTVKGNVTNEISVETAAFDAETLARMRGDSVDTSGLILRGGNRDRAFFAFGKVVKLRHGGVRYDWYPKCKLTENSDEASTKEESYSEQTDTLTIKAFGFNEAGDTCVSVDSTSSKFPEGLTEEKFFAKPILTAADLTAAVSAS